MAKTNHKLANSKEHDVQLQENGFRSVLMTTFITVFFAELGDKTQIATLLLTAQTGEPIIVFAGASVALICSSLVAVLLGSWIGRILPPDKFRLIAGIFMILIGIWLGINSGQPLFEKIKILT